MRSFLQGLRIAFTVGFFNFVLSAACFGDAPSSFQESQYYCAQVWACDENGDMLDEYNVPDDPCYQHYVLQCENTKLQLQDTSCTSELFEAQQTIEKLKKKIRELRREKKS